MANINGTNLAAPIVPFTTNDTFPTHYAKYGKGGYRTVATITERDGIFTALREEGMEVYVVETSKKYALVGGISNTNWVERISNVAGSNTQVMFNDNGVLAGSADLTYNKLSRVFKAGNTIREVSSSQFLHGAGNSFVTGAFNLGVGEGALSSIDTGTNNTAIGIYALRLTESGLGNTALGYNALGANVTGSGNFGLGFRSGELNEGYYNVFLGSYSGYKENNASYKLAVETDQSRNDNKDYLIEGDFSQRWVKFNGAVRKMVVNITAPSTALLTGSVTSVVGNDITDASKNMTEDAYKEKLFIVTGGTGYGSVSRIFSNTTNSFNLNTSIQIDNTSTYKVVDSSFVLNEKFNSIYIIDLSTEDYFLYFRETPLNGSTINIIINSNPNNKNLWINSNYGVTCKIFPYNSLYKNYSIPLKLYTFEGYIQGSNVGLLETTNDLNNLLQPIKSSTKDLVIDLYSKIYKVDVGTNTALTLNIDSSYVPILTNNALTIELHINMTVISMISWPGSVTWAGGSAPTFDATGKYAIVLRTMDAGVNWIANLAYTY